MQIGLSVLQLVGLLQGISYFFLEILLCLGKLKNKVPCPNPESEYMALCTITCDILWILKKLKDVKIDKLTPVSVL